MTFGQGAITLEYVGGQIAPDTVCADRPLILGLKITNTSGAPIQSFSTGFRVYSLDGAVWGGTSGQFVGGIESFMDMGSSVHGFSTDGNSADTIGVSGIALSGGSMAGSNDLHRLRLVSTRRYMGVGEFGTSLGRTVLFQLAFIAVSGYRQRWHRVWL